jgi:cellulose synthase/poly-beta-1,6-N-acetylglucosamine synthase-like glycosyltransferase
MLTPTTKPTGGNERTCSVIICAFSEERWDSLRTAVQTTLDQSDHTVQVVVVVDNNPQLAERANEAWSQITVVANEGARGLSGARNTGVRYATGSVIVFLDDDARPESGWLTELLAPYDDPRVVGTGGATLPLWASAQPSWFPQEFLWTVGCSYLGLSTSPAPTRNPIGANMSFRREVFEQVGEFTAQIGRISSIPRVSCDETEFSIRVADAIPEALIMHAPSARVAHLVPANRATWSFFRSRCWTEGRSKALVAETVGSEGALSSERAYTRSVLPRGIARGVWDAMRGDLSGLLRAGAIVVGLGITSTAYMKGRFLTLARSARWMRRRLPVRP